MQLTAAAVTPPAEHAARRPAGAADAAAADADVRQTGILWGVWLQRSVSADLKNSSPSVPDGRTAMILAPFLRSANDAAK